MFEDIADETLKLLKQADHDHTVEAFNSVLRMLAACQQRLKLRGVHLTVQPNGAVVISTIQDASGSSTSAYARVSLWKGEMTITGKPPAAPGLDDYQIESVIDPSKSSRE